MSEKIFPISQEKLEAIIQQYPTPFHLYDEKAIRQNIRRVDICTRYSSLQYLIILFEPDETHIPDIIERIFTQYYRQCDSHDFQPSYEYLKISPQEL